jgi:hypothetical protein
MEVDLIHSLLCQNIFLNNSDGISLQSDTAFHISCLPYRNILLSRRSHSNPLYHPSIDAPEFSTVDMSSPYNPACTSCNPDV